MTVIYADSLWMVNFSMDFLALYICGRFLKIPMKPLRLALAAAVGGVYGVASALLEFGMDAACGGVISALGAVICVAVMTALGFGAKGIAAIRTALTYTAVNVGLGGVMTSLYSIAGRAAGLLGIGGYDTSPSASPVFFAIAALISGAVSLAYGKFRNKSLEKREVAAELTLLGRSVPLKLLCDSGNLLKDPFLGGPVIVVSEMGIREILPEEWGSGNPEPPAIHSLKARLIPVSGVTGKGMLICFRPDRISVEGKTVEASVAIDSTGGNYGGCDGIIPQILINT